MKLVVHAMYSIFPLLGGLSQAALSFFLCLSFVLSCTCLFFFLAKKALGH